MPLWQKILVYPALIVAKLLLSAYQILKGEKPHDIDWG